MTELNESRVHRITSIAAARFMAEPRGHFLVMAFAHRARTVGSVAEALGLPMLAAFRLVRRAVVLGLLEERAEQPRRGRALKLYQAVAPVFVIPDELMPQLPGDLLAAELRARLREDVARHGSCHVISADAAGEPLMTALAADPAASVPFEAWRLLRLDRAAAAALEAELAAVLDRYEARQNSAGRTYLAHAAMVLRRR